MYHMKSDVNSPIKGTQSLLLASFRHVMRPFVRLLLRHGVTYTLLLEELKRVYVQIADSEFQIGSKKQTDSRINVLTGVHRKDVHRLRNELNVVKPPKANFSAQIIAHWIGSPLFIDADGNPKIIPRSSSQDNEPSFDGLVASVSKDIRSKSVFDEWLRTGIMTQLDNQMLKLNTESFIPQENFEDQLFFLGLNVHDHLAATVHNLQSDASKMMERCVYYDGLTLDQVDELHAYVRQKGSELINLTNRKAIKLQESAKSSNEAKYRMNAGVYFYNEPRQTDIQNHDDESSV